MKCPNCSQSLPAQALFCGACGQAVAPPVLAPAQLRPLVDPPEVVRPETVTAEPVGVTEHIACDECGAVMSVSDIFCGDCGRVSSTVSAAFSSARDTDSVTESILSTSPEHPVDGAAAPRLRGPESTIDSRTVRAPAPAPAPSAAGDAHDAQSTGIASAGAQGERFVLQFSTGESVTVSGTGLVGRNPVSEPGEYFDDLVRVLDSTRSVSKTHLEFGQQAGVFWVADRYSGNGTIVREPDRPGIRCEPGKRQIVSRGGRVVIGEQFFVVS
ncbi:double zinc ribbon domain-containing protein [Marisediminicola antarctica]|uniref:FHA domain-containing protein n=1 Tax=Marisediminicola antarctica TaxID=674079 RepID=A0A7L5AKM4_9MICO|nr:zinc ribbon domain-containing protein [Marisediminicola antarctica]QHO69671.1 hypothetical protein BHD05_08475 [Marisediminicola antarctica]